MSQSLMTPKQMKLPVHSLTRSLANLGRSGPWMTAVLFVFCQMQVSDSEQIANSYPLPFFSFQATLTCFPFLDELQHSRVPVITRQAIYTKRARTSRVEVHHAAWRRVSQRQLQILLTNVLSSRVVYELVGKKPQHIHAYGKIHARYVANITVIPTFWSPVIDTQPAH